MAAPRPRVARQLALPPPSDAATSAAASSTRSDGPSENADLDADIGHDALDGVFTPSASEVGALSFCAGVGDAAEAESDAGGPTPSADPERSFVPPPPEEGDD